MKKLLFIFLLFSLYNCSSKPVKSDGERVPSNFKSCLDMMTEMIAYVPHSGSADLVFSNARSLKKLEAKYGGASLLDIQYELSDEEIKKNNENIRKLVNAPYKLSKKKGKISVVTEVDADLIYHSMDASQVNKNHYCYDTKGTIGFCFGRATIAHMEAIARNIHPDAVKKIWIAGDMKKWGHHVATMIYTEKGWLVLDTNIGKPIGVDAWLDFYKPGKAKDAKEIMAFITQAGRFGPYDTSAYNAVDLFNTNSNDYVKAKDFFNGYFHDYFESLDNVKNPPLQKKE